MCRGWVIQRCADQRRADQRRAIRDARRTHLDQSIPISLGASATGFGVKSTAAPGSAWACSLVAAAGFSSDMRASERAGMLMGCRASAACDGSTSAEVEVARRSERKSFIVTACGQKRRDCAKRCARYTLSGRGASGFLAEPMCGGSVKLVTSYNKTAKNELPSP